MNTDTNHPSPEKDAELHAIQDFVWLYHHAQLAPEEAAKVEQLIVKDPRAAKSYQSCKEVDVHLATDDGKASAAKERSQIMQMLLERPRVSRAPQQSLSQNPTPITPEPRKTSAASLQKSLSSFFQRIKEALSPSDSPAALSGYAYAQSSVTEEFIPHLEGQVVTRLWKNEAGKTMLWVMTENSDYVSLHYQFVGGPSGPVLLKAEGGSFLKEIELDAGFVASGHPEITRTPSEHFQTS